MKRFGYLTMLMALSSSAEAGSSFSFVVGGHRVRIEAPRHCNSATCVSVSIPGIYETRRRQGGFQGRFDDIAAARDVAAAKPPTPAAEQVALGPIVPPLTRPSTEPVASAPLLPAPEDAVRPAPAAASQVLKISHQADDESAETPLGVWQTEAGSVRIEQCGRALCGYALDQTSSIHGETVLINMKPKAASEWSGNIYSRDSGDTYYATVAIKGPDSLQVEACAWGRFFCSGKLWSRIGATP